MVNRRRFLTLVAVVGTLADANKHDNHIFNQVHNALRQWGSAVWHNGMGFFLASVPSGTELYHGGPQNESVKGLEWLAFEPEHALFFTGWGQPPPGTQPGEPYKPGQQPLTERPPRPQHGYFHTYRTKHHLNLLYIEGQAAAKSWRGTLDTQDLILLHNNPPEPPAANAAALVVDGYTPPQLRGEAARATRLCELANGVWNGSVDGFLRMEMGFEVILCDFEKHLEVVRITMPSDRKSPSNNFIFDWGRAAASRYDGIGGGRVNIDYDSLVSMYDFPEVVYFGKDGFPRIDNTSETAIIEVQEALTAKVHRGHHSNSRDWQKISDMIADLYSERIQYLTSDTWQNLTKYKEEVNGVFRPFIDSYHHRNSTLEIERCSRRFFPSGVSGNATIPEAIFNVNRRICSTFHAASTSEDLEDSINKMRHLQTWLGWSEFKKCRGCDHNKICFVPMFPFGTQELFDEPACVDELEMGYEYWFRPNDGPPHRDL